MVGRTAWKSKSSSGSTVATRVEPSERPTTASAVDAASAASFQPLNANTRAGARSPSGRRSHRNQDTPPRYRTPPGPDPDLAAVGRVGFDPHVDAEANISSAGAEPAAAERRSRRLRGRVAMGVLSLAFVNIAAALSIRNFPTMAQYGWASIFWCLLGAIVFLIPLALAGAELGTGWPRSGGIGGWVQEAWGGRSGFTAIWCEWVENNVWFPTVLSFLATAIAYAIEPDLASERLYLVVVMLSVFWLATLVSLVGQRASRLLTTIGCAFGLVLPAALLIALGIGWLAAGRPSQIPFSRDALVPTLDVGTITFVATIVLMFAGQEMAGFHARDARSPRRDFPRAMLISAGVILSLTVLGTLAVAFVVPRDQISLVGGVMEALREFLDQIGIGWALRPLVILIVVGELAAVGTWIVGPAKGLLVPARRGYLPRAFQAQGRRGMPFGIIVIQGICGTIFSLLFLFAPGVDTAYWMLTALTVQVLCVMYLLCFSALIRLRYTQPDVERPFRIPGGIAGAWIVGGVGFLACLFAWVVGYLPPSNLQGQSPWGYVALMLGGTVVLLAPPFVFAALRRDAWRTKPEAEPEPAS
jgi:amino acid transporter